MNRAYNLWSSLNDRLELKCQNAMRSEMKRSIKRYSLHQLLTKHPLVAYCSRHFDVNNVLKNYLNRKNV